MFAISACDEHILHYLDGAIFEYKGKGFSFQIGFKEKEKIVSGSILERGTSWHNTNKCTLSMLKSILPDEIVVSQERGNGIIDTRIINAKKYEMRGKVFNCTIPDHYSNSRFNELFSYGDIFCEHLMNKRSELVLRLLRSIISEKCFSVDKTGFLTFVPYDSDSYVFYRNYNMQSLNNIAECYGLAMALVKTFENNRQEFTDYSFKSMTYHASSGIRSEGISLSFEYSGARGVTSLESW